MIEKKDNPDAPLSMENHIQTEDPKADAEGLRVIMRHALLKSEGIPALYEELQKKIEQKQQALKTKYTQAVCEKYRLFHVLTSSTLKTEPEKFDFPEPDSVKTFIETL